MNEWLKRHRTAIFVIVGLLIALAAGSLALRWQQPAPIVIEPPEPTPTSPPTATPGPILVYVSGAVANPDVYELPPDSLVRDAISAAGGAVGDADLNHINLALVLQDGDHVYIPTVGEPPTPAPDIAASPTPSGPININTATLEELDLLPGIGPALAERIIDYRETRGPFTAIEQIQNVAGIGPATFEDLQDLITIED